LVPTTWSTIASDYQIENSRTDMTPYERYRNTPLWDAVAKVVADLVENRDITEYTSRNYIFGYLCESLAEHISRQNKD
jgi:hypothetical protein